MWQEEFSLYKKMPTKVVAKMVKDINSMEKGFFKMQEKLRQFEETKEGRWLMTYIFRGFSKEKYLP